MMRYYDIHVDCYGNGLGYSIPVAIEDGDKEAAVEKAKEEKLFSCEYDFEDIDCVTEISEEEYLKMSR